MFPSKQINVESTLKQPWPLTFINVVQRWYLVENESWADVHLPTLFQRWRNNVETILIELRRFNVDEPTLFQRWNLIENESWAEVCLSTLFQLWQNNVETTLIELRWFNFDWKLHWNNFVNRKVEVHQKVAQWQSKIKFPSINHIFFLYRFF